MNCFKNFTCKLILFFLLVGSFGCKKNIHTDDGGGKINVSINYKGGEALAKVGDITLSLEALNEDFLQRQGQFKGAAHLNTDNKKTEFVENQVIQEAMFQEAIKAGYFNNAEVIRDVKKIVVQRLMRDKLSETQNITPPTEEEMKAHYEKNQNLYNRAEAEKVSFLEIPLGPDPKKTKSKAESIYKEALQTVKNGNTNALSQIAMKHAKNSKEAMTQIQVQMTGFLEKEPFENKFGPGSFLEIKKLENIGEFGPLIKNDKAYFVMMKIGARKEIKESFEEAKQKIEKRLGFENRSKNYEQYVKSLHEKYKINVNKDKVALLGKDSENNKTNVASTDNQVEE